MKWKDIAADYLSFTRKERIALLVLITILLAVFLFPSIYNHSGSRKFVPTDTSWVAAIRKLEVQEKQKPGDYSKKPGYNDNHAADNFDRPATLFYFDPNTLDREGWLKLGLKEKTVHTIQNYLGKGGHFFKATDLEKIYGLPPGDYARIAPYIKIEPGPEPGSTTGKQMVSRTPPFVVDINSADSSELIALPGIGSRLAARIISFREKLGGFYSIAQVAETYGLADSVFQKLKPYLKLDNPSLKKIDINTATVDELKAHPYIRFGIANAIVAYRKEHGPFLSVADLKKIVLITDEVFGKISPYLFIPE